jgi:hypothetical protein
MRASKASPPTRDSTPPRDEPTSGERGDGEPERARLGRRHAAGGEGRQADRLGEEQRLRVEHVVELVRAVVAEAIEPIGGGGIREARPIAREHRAVSVLLRAVIDLERAAEDGWQARSISKRPTPAAPLA